MLSDGIYTEKKLIRYEYHFDAIQYQFYLFPSITQIYSRHHLIFFSLFQYGGIFTMRNR